ncbi:MAG: cytochrome c5 family protein [Nevskia sp.]
MSKNHDTAFMTSFLGVLAGLVAITFAIIFLASLVTRDETPKGELLKKVEARIAPVGIVITDPAALVKVSTAAAKHAPLAADQVFATVCSACHTSGLLGAPKIGDKAAWSARKSAAGGLDGLAASAIKGKNSMPARGGNADLSDEEIKSTVDLMLKKTGA